MPLPVTLQLLLPPSSIVYQGNNSRHKKTLHFKFSRMLLVFNSSRREERGRELGDSKRLIKRYKNDDSY